MPENENRPPAQEQTPPPLPDTPAQEPPPLSDGSAPLPQNGAPPPPPRQNTAAGDGCLGFFVGLFVGALYLSLVFWGVVMLKWSFLSDAVASLMAILGPVPVWFYARRTIGKAFFWGFLIPYLLLLMLFGTCTGFIR